MQYGFFPAFRRLMMTKRLTSMSLASAWLPATLIEAQTKEPNFTWKNLQGVIPLDALKITSEHENLFNTQSFGITFVFSALFVIPQRTNWNPSWMNLVEQRKESTLIILVRGWPGLCSIPWHKRRQVQKGLQDQHIICVNWLIMSQDWVSLGGEQCYSNQYKSCKKSKIHSNPNWVSFLSKHTWAESVLVTPSPFFFPSLTLLTS